MKLASSDLHQLIQNMTLEEKRFFRMVSYNQRTGKESLDQLLFDAIEKQQGYDEPALKKQFVKLNENQFAVAKNQLYQSLLRALVFFAPDRGYRRKIQMLLRQVEILFHRELYDQCRKLLDRATRLAAQSDNPMLQLETAEWRIRLWTSQYFKAITPDYFNEVNNVLLKSAEKALRLAEYQTQTNELVYHFRTHSVLQTQTDYKSAHEERMASPLFTEIEMADSIPARILYHYGNGFYLFMVGTPQESFTHYTSIMRHLEENPENLYDYFNFYLPIIYGHAVLGLSIGDYAAALQSIEKIEKLQTENPSQKTKNFYFSFILKIEYLFATNQEHTLRMHLESADKRVSQVEKYISPQEILNFFVNTCNGWYVVDEKSKALRWLHRMLQFPQIAAYPDYYFMGMTLRILIHYELKNEDVLPSLIRSLQRWMEKRISPFRTEEHIAEYMVKVIHATTQQEVNTLFTELKDLLTQLAANPGEKRISRYFDYVCWLDSQLEGIPYGTIIRRKAGA